MLDNKIIKLDDFNPPQIAKKIALRMKQMRISKNMTQQDLASRSEVSLGSLKRFETQSLISLHGLIRIAVVLGATEGFKSIFQVNEFDTMDQLLSSQNSKTRKRARNA